MSNAAHEGTFNKTAEELARSKGHKKDAPWRIRRDAWQDVADLIPEIERRD